MNRLSRCRRQLHKKAKNALWKLSVNICFGLRMRKIKCISTGYSCDKKFQAYFDGKKVFLRVISKEREKIYESAYRLFQEKGNLPIPFVNPLVIKKRQNETLLVLPWIDGLTLNDIIKKSRASEQLAERIYEQTTAFHETTVDLSHFTTLVESLQEKLQLFKMSQIDLFGYAPEILSYVDKLLPSIKERPVGFLHGDLNVDNIIIDSTGEVFLVDYEMLMVGDPLWDWAEFFSCLVSSGDKASYSFRHRIVEDIERKYSESIWGLLCLYNAIRRLGLVGKLGRYPKLFNDPLIWENLIEDLRVPKKFRNRILVRNEHTTKLSTI